MMTNQGCRFVLLMTWPRRPADGVSLEFPTGVRRRVATPRGVNRPAVPHNEVSPKARARVHITSDDVATATRIKTELAQREHLGCVEPISIADAANDTIIDTRCVHMHGPTEVRRRLVAKRNDTFAATPAPAGKFIIDLLVAKRCWGAAEDSLALLHAGCSKRVIVRPPPQAEAEGYNPASLIGSSSASLWGAGSTVRLARPCRGHPHLPWRCWRACWSHDVLQV